MEHEVLLTVTHFEEILIWHAVRSTSEWNAKSSFFVRCNEYFGMEREVRLTATHFEEILNWHAGSLPEPDHVSNENKVFGVTPAFSEAPDDFVIVCKGMG